MFKNLRFAAVTAVVLGAASAASAQSVLFDFENGTDQGFGAKFSNDASESFPIVNIGGSNRMFVARNNDFQEAQYATGDTSLPFFQALLAASADEANFVISYDYYIDTGAYGTGAGNFFQLGTYVNSGSGYYAQNFGTPKEFELNGTDLASGAVFAGTVSQTFAAKGFNIPTGENFFALGLILNGDGAAQGVYYDNISVSPVPEPTSLSFAAVAGTALLARHRRA